MKVLVVDDDAESRILMAELLSRLSVNHATVATPGECLARLVSNPTEFSLVLMDIHMPALSGVDVSTWIKGIEIDPPRSIPIIAVTGDESYHDEARVARLGMQGVLGKPVTLECLRDMLYRHSQPVARQ